MMFISLHDFPKNPGPDFTSCASWAQVKPLPSDSKHLPLRLFTSLPQEPEEPEEPEDGSIPMDFTINSVLLVKIEGPVTGIPSIIIYIPVPVVFQG